MDARNPAARREIAALADLAGAVRLPSRAHQRAAGTARRHRPADPPPPRTRPRAGRHRAGSRPGWPNSTACRSRSTNTSSTTRTPCSASSAPSTARHNAEDLVVAASGDTGAALARALTRDRRRRRIPRAHLDRTERKRAASGTGRAAVPAAGRLPASPPRRHLHPGHRRARASRSRYRPARAPSSGSSSGSATRSPACWKPKPPRSTTPPSWTTCAGTSTSATTATCRAYGPISRFSWRRTGRTDPATGEEKLARIRPPQGGFRSDPFAPLVQALEEFDPVSQTAAKAAIFTGRVVAPRNPRLGADTPRRRAGDLPGRLRRSPAERDRPAARHRRGPGPPRPRHPGLRRPRNPGGWYRPPNTCPAGSGTSSKRPNGPRQTIPATRSTSPNCARSSRPT